MTALARTDNPLLSGATAQTLNPELITIRAHHRRQLNTARRQLRDLRKIKTAREVMEGFDHTTEIYGFTKGQFSALDLIGATLEIIGPASLSLSTWAVAPHQLQTVADLYATGKITATRWLIDFSLARREPAITGALRATFGPQNIRVAQTHAKIYRLRNAQWAVMLRTSMNLTGNPRYEDFTIAHDPELADFLDDLFDDIWKRQPVKLATDRPHAIAKHFREEM